MSNTVINSLVKNGKKYKSLKSAHDNIKLHNYELYNSAHKASGREVYRCNAFLMRAIAENGTCLKAWVVSPSGKQIVNPAMDLTKEEYHKFIPKDTFTPYEL